MMTKYIVVSVVREVCIGYHRSTEKNTWFSPGGSMGCSEEKESDFGRLPGS